MKTYWEFSEYERSKLTEDEVKMFLAHHLMERGVLKIVAPTLRTIEQEPVLAKKAWYEVNDVYFDSAEKAQAFLELLPYRTNYEYALGYEYKFPVPLSQEIRRVDLYERQAIMDAKTVLAKNKSAKEENEKAERKFEADSKKMRSCLDEVWSDWYACLELAVKHKKVMDTMNEYLKLANDDAVIASGFLAKVFTQEEIDEATKWFQNVA